MALAGVRMQRNSSRYSRSAGVEGVELCAEERTAILILANGASAWEVQVSASTRGVTKARRFAV